MNNSRLQYEQWQININGFDTTDFKRSAKSPDEYQYQAIQRDWIVWQAAIEQASQRIAQLEAYISNNLHKKAFCGCGDSIEPDTGAVCGNCASETQINLERLIEAEQASQPQAEIERDAARYGWLKTSDHPGAIGLRVFFRTSGNLDAAIDAVMPEKYF